MAGHAALEAPRKAIKREHTPHSETCSACFTSKPREAFSSNRLAKLGRTGDGRCRLCVANNVRVGGATASLHNAW